MFGQPEVEGSLFLRHFHLTFPRQSAGGHRHLQGGRIHALLERPQRGFSVILQVFPDSPAVSPMT